MIPKIEKWLTSPSNTKLFDTNFGSVYLNKDAIGIRIDARVTRLNSNSIFYTDKPSLLKIYLFKPTTRSWFTINIKKHDRKN